MLPGIANNISDNEQGSQGHVQFSWEWGGLKGIWIVWNSGEVLPDRIKVNHGVVVEVRWRNGGGIWSAEEEALAWKILSNKCKTVRSLLAICAVLGENYRKSSHLPMQMVPLHNNTSSPAPQMLTLKQRLVDISKLGMISVVF